MTSLCNTTPKSALPVRQLPCFSSADSTIGLLGHPAAAFFQYQHDAAQAHVPVCSCPTRDRLKLIARVANKEEWAKAAPLSGAEYRLLSNYNDKPLLTRPQQRYVDPDGAHAHAHGRCCHCTGCASAIALLCVDATRQ